KQEQHAIEAWLRLIGEAARLSGDLALEVAECARLIKGYGDTLKRGSANYRLIETRIIRPILAGGIPLPLGIDAIARPPAAARAPGGRPSPNPRARRSRAALTRSSSTAPRASPPNSGSRNGLRPVERVTSSRAKTGGPQMRIDAYTHFFPKKFFDKMQDVAGNYKDMGKRVRSLPALFDLD